MRSSILTIGAVLFFVLISVLAGMEKDFDDVRAASEQATASITDGRVIAKQEKMEEKIKVRCELFFEL